MAALLVMLGVMGILSTVLLPVWSQAAKGEREAELIFRGEQYARAVELYQRRYIGANPPDLETLVEQRFLRKMYADPMTEDGEFRIVYSSQVAGPRGEPATADRPGESTSDARVATPIEFGNGEEGGVVGVVSQSDEQSLRIYNDREKYNEWAFVYTSSATEPGALAGAGGVEPTRRGPGGAGRDRSSEPFNLGRRGDGDRQRDQSRRPAGTSNRGTVDGPPLQPRGLEPR